MNTRNIKLAGALLFGILISTAVNAQSHRQGGQGQGHGAGDGQNGMYRHASLDLTEEQQTEITTLRTAHFKAITPLKNKMVELKARDRTMLSVATLSMETIPAGKLPALLHLHYLFVGKQALLRKQGTFPGLQFYHFIL